MDSSKFSHTERTQMSSPKLFSITRVSFQMNIKKRKKKKYLVTRGKKNLLNKDNFRYSRFKDSEQISLEFYLGFISPWCQIKCIQKTSRTTLQISCPTLRHTRRGCGFMFHALSTGKTLISQGKMGKITCWSSDGDWADWASSWAPSSAPSWGSSSALSSVCASFLSVASDFSFSWQ